MPASSRRTVGQHFFHDDCLMRRSNADLARGAALPEGMLLRLGRDLESHCWSPRSTTTGMVGVVLVTIRHITGIADAAKASDGVVID